MALTRPGDEVVLCTRNGMAIRFDEADARAMGRNTRGVKGIDLREGDEVVGMVGRRSGGFLLTVCENGYGKRTPFGANTAGVEVPEAEARRNRPRSPRKRPSRPRAKAADSRGNMRYRKQRRGGKGVRDIRTSERNGPVHRRALGSRRRRHHAHHRSGHGQPHPRQRRSAWSAVIRRACGSWA